ncbi:hypothetical protein RJ639_033747 [Escallonia herrerae]|uniref:SLL1 protein n=1 Tax=Escallonia herrerae TaxID=1293975 RepID=A0AA88WU79_9ASTE|nr:hypothetical protein RJ639_033747 [Escallonia herrerae]
MALASRFLSKSKQLHAGRILLQQEHAFPVRFSAKEAAPAALKGDVNRGFHSTGVKRMGGGHAHGHDEPFYIHAKHMYNLDRMKHQKLKMSLGVLTAFSIGVAVPVYAVIFQQKKTASG